MKLKADVPRLTSSADISVGLENRRRDGGLFRALARLAEMELGYNTRYNNRTTRPTLANRWQPTLAVSQSGIACGTDAWGTNLNDPTLFSIIIYPTGRFQSAVGCTDSEDERYDMFHMSRVRLDSQINPTTLFPG